jgi:hypothetical protein
MDEVIVHIEVEVNPTESEEKVKQAVENVFGALSMQAKSVGKIRILTVQASGKEPLTKLHNLLRREHIRAAARVALLEGLSRKTISFCLNKQVAYAEHISFAKEVAESPLGPIRVKIECENPRELINWLTYDNF